MNLLLDAASAFALTFTVLAVWRGLRRPPSRVWPPVACAGVHGRRFVLRWQRSGPRRTEELVADLLDEVGGGLRSGASLVVALRDAAGAERTVDGLRDALGRVERGATLAAALDGWRETTADAPTRLAATALAHSAALGGGDARPLEAVADTLRERVALRGELRTQAAQARASAGVLMVLPPAFLVVVASIDRDVADVVLRTPLGWSCLAVGLLLDALGALWMVRIIDRTAG
jgi:tight adherence protein B